MKKWLCFFALTMPAAVVFAQGPSNTATASHTGNKKVISLSGEVSDDGTTLLNDSINKWTVSNTASLKGHEGQYVTVRCRVDPDKHTILVLSLAPERVVKINLSDSAFRR